jgi:hypothetical protein
VSRSRAGVCVCVCVCVREREREREREKERERERERERALLRTTPSPLPCIAQFSCQLGEPGLVSSSSPSLTRQGVVLTDFSHILIINKTSRALLLSLSLSLSLQISLSLCLRVASLEETIIKASKQLLKLGADP